MCKIPIFKSLKVLRIMKKKRKLKKSIANDVLLVGCRKDVEILLVTK
jgi:hypothetical protein